MGIRTHLAHHRISLSVLASTACWAGVQRLWSPGKGCRITRVGSLTAPAVVPPPACQNPARLRWNGAPLLQQRFQTGVHPPPDLFLPAGRQNAVPCEAAGKRPLVRDFALLAIRSALHICNIFFMQSIAGLLRNASQAFHVFLKSS